MHHAGLLPKYRRLVEKLAQAGLLKVVCGTDTLGVGVNIPIRTVLFTELCKYDGEKTALLQAREFHQIAGRAGRAVRHAGSSWCRPPSTSSRTTQALAKAGDARRREGRAQEAARGFVSWDQPTFDQLVAASRSRWSPGSRSATGCC